MKKTSTMLKYLPIFWKILQWSARKYITTMHKGVIYQPYPVIITCQATKRLQINGAAPSFSRAIVLKISGTLIVSTTLELKLLNSITFWRWRMINFKLIFTQQKHTHHRQKTHHPAFKMNLGLLVVSWFRPSGEREHSCCSHNEKRSLSLLDTMRLRSSVLS